MLVTKTIQTKAIIISKIIMKKIKFIIKKLIINSFVARIIIRYLLRGHSFCYKWSGLMACELNDGIHPKHEIIKYKEWFLSNILPSWTVLDIGCGNGLMPYVFSKKIAYVYGIEMNKERVEHAELKYSSNNISYFCADATQFDYSKCRPINCITLSNVLEHIKDRVVFLKALVQKVNWAETHNKKFLIRVPMIDREWIVLYKKKMGIEYRLDPTHHIEYTYEEFEKELTLAGLVIKSFRICYGEIYAICQTAE